MPIRNTPCYAIRYYGTFCDSEENYLPQLSKNAIRQLPPYTRHHVLFHHLTRRWNECLYLLPPISAVPKIPAGIFHTNYSLSYKVAEISKGYFIIVLDLNNYWAIYIYVSLWIKYAAVSTALITTYRLATASIHSIDYDRFINTDYMMIDAIDTTKYYRR